MKGDTLIVFVKRPRSGEVKTRLAADIGADAAADVYRTLAEIEIEATRPNAGDYERLFFFAPANAQAEMEAWWPGETWLPQQGSDLGARMANAFGEAFGRGARRVAIIGTDVPWVSRETVAGALAALDECDVVIGPAHDGGYYLLALNAPRPELFQGIEWSTDAVLRETRARIAALGLEGRELPMLTDIDTLEDLRAAWNLVEPRLARRWELPAERRHGREGGHRA